jgi:tetratricopeptide (TPR) repeat protein
MESLAELGILGLVLVAGFILAVVGIGAVRTVRGPPELRTGRAAAAAGCVGFAVAAGLDWVWELAVLPAIFVVLAAVAVGAGAGTGLGRPPNRGVARNRRLPLPDPARLAVIGLAVAALVAIVLPLAENVAIEKSRAAFARGDLGAALSSARDAAAVQPYSATPRLQEALVFEQQGNLTDALAAARLAVRRETTNWRHWLVLSRLEARRGSIDAAIDDYRHARALNPRSNALVPGAVGR